MGQNTALRVDDADPILLRRARPRPFVREITANMTVVTTQGNRPEMGDQMDDPTAPRND